MFEGIPETDWDWYFMMQHHGLPTRLLDWTQGVLIAAYFALRENAPDVDAAVWMLDPWWLNKCVLGRWEIMFPDEVEAGPYLPPVFQSRNLPVLPLALMPAHITKRISAQKGCFTVFGHETDGLMKLAVTRDDARLWKIILDKDAIMQMQMDLEVCGVGETTVFPDIEALGRELLGMWREE